MKNLTINYRVITPDSLSDLDTFTNKEGLHKSIDTKEEAMEALQNFGSTDPKSEYFKYNEEVRSKCKIVKVTTIIDDDLDSENNFHICDEAVTLLREIATYASAGQQIPLSKYKKVVDVIENSNV